jgi:methylglutaconyl-CoA hydratase
MSGGLNPGDVDPVLRITENEGVRTLFLSRPERRNALGRALVGALMQALDDAEGDDGIRVVLIRGDGPDFCSGADLEELEQFAALGPKESLEDAARLGDLFIRLRTLTKPVIAAVHGRALAGGAGLATGCDLLLMREDAEIGYPEVHLAFVPAMVMAMLRRRVPEHVAFELVAVGDRISASEAFRIGLVNRVLPAEGFDNEVDAYAATLSSRPASSISLAKGLLHELEELDFAEGIRRGTEVNALARATEECRTRVQRFLSRGK